MKASPSACAMVCSRGGKPTREQVVKLAGYFKVKETDLLVAWLSDKVVYELEDEEVALQALQVAEEKVKYQKSKHKK